MAPKNEIWVSVSVDYTSHPKVVQSGSDGAVMNLGAIGYSRKFLTDGFVPASAIAGLAPTVKRPAATAKLLVASGLWSKVEGGYQVHDYAVWNQTKATVQKQREKWKGEKREQRGGELSGVDIDTDNSLDMSPERGADSRVSAGRAQSPSLSVSGGVGALEGGAGETVPPRSVSPAERAHRGHGFPDSCAIGKCLMPTQADAFEKQLIANNGGIFPDGANIRQFAADVVAEWTAKGVPADDTFKAWQAVFERRMGVRRGELSTAKHQPAHMMDWAEECDRLHGGKCGGQYRHGLTMKAAKVAS